MKRQKGIRSVTSLNGKGGKVGGGGGGGGGVVLFLSRIWVVIHHNEEYGWQSTIMKNTPPWMPTILR